MFNPTNYRNLLANKMPGELSPDLLEKIVLDLAVIAGKFPLRKLLKFLAWYLHGIATARCFKALPSMEIAAITMDLAHEIVDMIQKDIRTMITDLTAA